ncbi:hypothetical protein G210_3451 [Candida maltosa Xu316]|uniref:Uncharacterized protein n=1 Tax=Candida maltosa (strain Xu316) TaxID=1245528 RepID=M3JTW4_CANMX|nr:hypothetical protein G210_3451 [Candida maltosa Xu316]
MSLEKSTSSNDLPNIPNDPTTNIDTAEDYNSTSNTTMELGTVTPSGSGSAISDHMKNPHRFKLSIEDIKLIIYLIVKIKPFKYVGNRSLSQTKKWELIQTRYYETKESNTSNNENTTETDTTTTATSNKDFIVPTVRTLQRQLANAIKKAGQRRSNQLKKGILINRHEIPNTLSQIDNDEYYQFNDITQNSSIEELETAVLDLQELSDKIKLLKVQSNTIKVNQPSKQPRPSISHIIHETNTTGPISLTNDSSGTTSSNNSPTQQPQSHTSTSTATQTPLSLSNNPPPILPQPTHHHHPHPHPHHHHRHSHSQQGPPLISTTSSTSSQIFPSAYQDKSRPLESGSSSTTTIIPPSNSSLENFHSTLMEYINSIKSPEISDNYKRGLALSELLIQHTNEIESIINQENDDFRIKIDKLIQDHLLKITSIKDNFIYKQKQLNSQLIDLFTQEFKNIDNSKIIIDKLKELQELIE